VFPKPPALVGDGAGEGCDEPPPPPEPPLRPGPVGIFLLPPPPPPAAVIVEKVELFPLPPLSNAGPALPAAPTVIG
jgi:hypothetical protein